ncbi:hypothetical protein K431DRAFT_282038 [Polychaeton citri CBS 116435]|uniref:Uncharacterized protein n=1 Tax=Polychaeton citri CBS 116435 TaxID=1314669 RepID=A0A9P4UQJ9_9PEZI|nr:hypothetical protein K431DRAFT_282038 [Polychaeton citri CBS 116435]
MPFPQAMHRQNVMPKTSAMRPKNIIAIPASSNVHTAMTGKISHATSTVLAKPSMVGELKLRCNTCVLPRTVILCPSAVVPLYFWGTVLPLQTTSSSLPSWCSIGTSVTLRLFGSCFNSIAAVGLAVHRCGSQGIVRLKGMNYLRSETRAYASQRASLCYVERARPAMSLRPRCTKAERKSWRLSALQTLLSRGQTTTCGDLSSHYRIGPQISNGVFHRMSVRLLKT